MSSLYQIKSDTSGVCGTRMRSCRPPVRSRVGQLVADSRQFASDRAGRDERSPGRRLSVGAAGEEVRRSLWRGSWFGSSRSTGVFVVVGMLRAFCFRFLSSSSSICESESFSCRTCSGTGRKSRRRTSLFSVIFFGAGGEETNPYFVFVWCHARLRSSETWGQWTGLQSVSLLCVRACVRVCLYM